MRPRSCRSPARRATSAPRWSAWPCSADGLGLRADLHEHDLAALRAHPGHPGEEAARGELWEPDRRGRRRRGAGRLALSGHIDTVPEGTVPWRHGPWSGALEDGWLYGRGSVDMKGAVVAALHALAEVARAAAQRPMSCSWR